MANGAALTIRSNNDNLTDLAKGLSQSNNAGRMNAVIVGNKNQHGNGHRRMGAERGNLTDRAIQTITQVDEIIADLLQDAMR